MLIVINEPVCTSLNDVDFNTFKDLLNGYQLPFKTGYKNKICLCEQTISIPDEIGKHLLSFYSNLDMSTEIDVGNKRLYVTIEGFKDDRNESY